jgi:hypothetical protein
MTLAPVCPPATPEWEVVLSGGSCFECFETSRCEDRLGARVSASQQCSHDQRVETPIFNSPWLRCPGGWQRARIGLESKRLKSTSRDEMMGKSRASTQVLRFNTLMFTSYKAHHHNKSRNSAAMGMLLAVSLVLVCVLVLVRTWWPGAGVLTLRNDAAVRIPIENGEASDPAGPGFWVTANTSRSIGSSVCVEGPLQFRNELASNACYSCSLVSISV